MAIHKDLADAELHEPKGAATAAVNTVYHADGSGSGAWAKVGTSQLDATSIFNTNKFQLTAEFVDVSSADTILIPLPFACTLNKVTTILHTAITTADATLTVTNPVGPATIGTITVAFTSSAPGDIDTLTAASNNTFAAGSYIKIATDGGSTVASRLGLLLEFTRTA